VSARILDGKAAAAEIRAELAAKVAELGREGVRPKISLVRVGEDPASVVYVRNKAKACVEVGIDSEVLVLPETSSAEEVAEAIDRRVADPLVHGILLQLPLPAGLPAQQLVERIVPEKDVDGFHPVSLGRLCLGQPGFVPCTPLGSWNSCGETASNLRASTSPSSGGAPPSAGRSRTCCR